MMIDVLCAPMLSTDPRTLKGCQPLQIHPRDYCPRLRADALPHIIAAYDVFTARVVMSGYDFLEHPLALASMPKRIGVCMRSLL